MATVELKTESVSSSITRIAYSNDNLGVVKNLGVYGAEYEINGEPVDFQDLVVAISTDRATVLEEEITPLSTRIRKRNEELEELGNALSELSRAQASYANDATGGTNTEISGSDVISLIKSLGGDSIVSTSGDKTYISKSNCEKAIQLVKTQMDKLNNESSSDMTRLQSLVDSRDNAYSTATSLMESIADTRSSVIKNMSS